MNNKPYTAILVSHTHWDRAWYLPFQVFRIRLVRLIDRLVGMLQRAPDFHSFMLDGQMIAIEDYLEVRPHQEPVLKKLVQEGRLFVGPWYVLADEYLVSPESLIRNLTLGMRMAQDFGPIMMEGYVPDAFGHISQLPQILQSFGIESAIFWRGVGDEGEELGTEFWWEAPDGSRVLVVFLRDGYDNAANLGFPMRWGDTSAMAFNMDLALARLRKAIDILKPYAHTPYLLLMNGIDHAEAQPEVPQIIHAVNEAFPDAQIVQGTLSEYIQRVREVGQDLPTFRGEFNRSRYAVILQGVYSSRIYIKQANERAQTLLERYAEPLCTWASLLSGDYPRDFLWKAWRLLLQNHPHDDICGCSVDPVHQEDMARFAQVEQIGQTLVRNASRQLTARIDRTAHPGVPLMVYNPLAWARTEALQAVIPFDMDDPTAEGFTLIDPEGQSVLALQVLGEEELFWMEVLKGAHRRGVRVAFTAENLPPCGYRVYYAVPGAPPASSDPEAVQVIEQGMENRHLRVKINPNGSLDVMDKATGRCYRTLGYFADTEDAGDEYDYAPCPNSETVASLGTIARVRLLHAGPVQVTYEIALTLNLPIGLTPDRQALSPERVSCPITSEVTLHRGSQRIECVTRVDNCARDHRLRVCFPTGLSTDEVVADGHFAVIRRAIAPPAGIGWAQPPVPTKHQRYFVDVSDGREGLAVFNRGLPEYEILRDDKGCNTIAVTLLRCVGWLSRGDLRTRPVYVGPSCATPQAQCPGEHIFEYALYPHAGGWEEVYREAYNYAAPLHLSRADEHEGFVPEELRLTPLEGPVTMRLPPRTGPLPGELSFLSIEPATLVLSAIKRSERTDGLIVRFYNVESDPVTATIRLFRPIREAYRVNLNEERQEALTVHESGAVSVPVRGKQVITLELGV